VVEKTKESPATVRIASALLKKQGIFENEYEENLIIVEKPKRKGLCHFRIYNLYVYK
jgi:hypothetical protein